MSKLDTDGRLAFPWDHTTTFSTRTGILAICLQTVPYIWAYESYCVVIVLVVKRSSDRGPLTRPSCRFSPSAHTICVASFLNASFTFCGVLDGLLATGMAIDATATCWQLQRIRFGLLTTAALAARRGRKSKGMSERRRIIVWTLW